MPSEIPTPPLVRLSRLYCPSPCDLSLLGCAGEQPELALGMELCRCTELLFNPALGGRDGLVAGVHELVAAQALSRIGFDIDFEGHFFFDRVQAIAQLIKV